jgi:ABC-2 type transport system permease protein
MLPLLSPFVMFTRMTVATVPLWQIALSIVVNLVSAYLIVIAAGKIYRVGLLMYGKVPKFSQVLATLRG